MKRDALIERMDQIGRAVATYEGTAQLLALGSIGLELDRLDAYSDLDFFLIVEDGQKERFLETLDWLEVEPIAYQFRNTRDGYKVLYADGIYAEFAVFDLLEMAHIGYTPGRIVWQRDDAYTSLAIPKTTFASREPAFHYEEALTNVYVGLLRERRGERLAALQLVQGSAVDNVIRALGETSDPFNPTRRVEQTHAALVPFFEGAVTGYGRTDEAAAHILRFIEARYDVNPTLRREIMALLET